MWEFHSKSARHAQVSKKTWDEYIKYKGKQWFYIVFTKFIRNDVGYRCILPFQGGIFHVFMFSPIHEEPYGQRDAVLPGACCA